MGACASFPKILGGKAPVAEPEQPKEEITVAVVVADKAVEEVKAEEEVKTEEVQEKSLVSLPEASGEVKKETDEVAAPAVEVAVEEVKAAPAPSAVEEKKTDKSSVSTEEPKKE